MVEKTVHGQMIHRAKADAVALYRLFDEGGSLLYAGISKDPMHRWEEHSGNAWWTQVATYTVTWYAVCSEARAAEKVALATEGPIHNVHSAPGHSAHWKAALSSAENRAGRAARSKRPAKKSPPAEGSST